MAGFDGISVSWQSLLRGGFRASLWVFALSGLDSVGGVKSPMLGSKSDIPGTRVCFEVKLSVCSDALTLHALNARPLH